MPDRPIASVQTIDRVSHVLKALSEGQSGGMRLSDVATHIGLGKTTALRLLKALIEVGYVEYDDSRKLYRLGYCLINLGNTARRFHIVELARPGLTRLASITGDTVFLSVRDGQQAHCVDRQTGSYPIRTLTLSVGDRRPLGVGAGSLALLAFETDTEVERILAANRESRRNFANFQNPQLKEMIAEARNKGYSFNDGRIVSAMNAVGVPVLDRDGHVACALSIAAIRERIEPPRLAELVSHLQSEARALAQALDSRNATAQHGQPVQISEVQ